MLDYGIISEILKMTNQKVLSPKIVKKIKISEIKIDKPKTPGVVPKFIGWVKKGKDATCNN